MNGYIDFEILCSVEVHWHKIIGILLGVSVAVCLVRFGERKDPEPRIPLPGTRGHRRGCADGDIFCEERRGDVARCSWAKRKVFKEDV